MKKAFLTIAVVALCVSLNAQTAAPAAAQPNTAATVQKTDDVVKFKDKTHNFGKIKQGTPVTYDFPFINVSGKPLVVESAVASCGCTTPTWPQAPVAKDKADKITAGFNAANPGPFTKTITVKLSGLDTPVQLTITGEVLNADDYAKYSQEKEQKKGK